MLTVSLDGLSSSCILCAQCWQCLSIVCLHPVSCVPNVGIVSRLFIFILYLVYPMLTVSLDCLSSSCILCAQCWHCLSSVYLHPVSCVPNVDIVSRLFIFRDTLSSSCILCTQCWQCLSIVYLHPVSCVPMLTVSLDCLSSSCILCAQCWYCLSIVFLHPVSWVPNVDSVSRLFIFILYLVCPMLTLSLDCLSSETLYLHPVSCVPMLTVSLDCLSSSCILCAQCWHCLSSVYLHPVSCVPNVDSVSRLFIFILYLVYPMLTVSLDCLSSSCILCA